MKKRTVIFSLIILSFLSFSIYRLYSLSQGKVLQTAAINNTTYKLKVASIRGKIYDCNKIPLVNTQKNTIAAIFPKDSTPRILSKLISFEKLNQILPLLQNKKPFCIQIDNDHKYLNSDDIQYFDVPKRYSENQLSPHILGYLNSDGEGVFGIEKAFNQSLNESKGTIELKYKMNALGKLLSENQCFVEDNIKKQNQGVVLTLDKKIQTITQDVAQKYLKKGAIIVTEVPNCKIRAFCSMPNFDPENIAQYLNRDDSPLINRGLSAYNLGSIFKLVSMAAAAESNLNLYENFNCKGSINVLDGTYHCHNNTSHQNVNGPVALAHSCNTYFVNLCKNLNPDYFLNFAKQLGFGNKIELAPNMFSSAGILPNAKNLNDPKIMANLSFGQGKLMATPLQVSGLINSIAANGVCTEPSLVEGFVNENLEFTKKASLKPSRKVFSKNTADILKEGMMLSANIGTGVSGKPENISVAVKTGTAQTGIKVNERFILQAWYAGFFPIENPKYSIVVFAEDAESGGRSCGPAFKRLVEEFYNHLILKI